MGVLARGVSPRLCVLSPALHRSLALGAVDFDCTHCGASRPARRRGTRTRRRWGTSRRRPDLVRRAASGLVLVLVESRAGVRPQGRRKGARVPRHAKSCCDLLYGALWRNPQPLCARWPCTKHASLKHVLVRARSVWSNVPRAHRPSHGSANEESDSNELSEGRVRVA